MRGPGHERGGGTPATVKAMAVRNARAEPVTVRMLPEVSLLSAALGAWAVMHQSFWLLVTATVVAGYYSANAQLYRFAAAELCAPEFREKAVSLVMAGGLIGAVIGPNLAMATKNMLPMPFAGAYAALAVIAVVSMCLMVFIQFPAAPQAHTSDGPGRPLREIMLQPVFVVAAMAAALGYGVMNLLMAATPLAMQVCGLPFESTAWVLEWHVIGMFAPGFFTGHLIKRFGVLPVMGTGVLLNLGCIFVALLGNDLHYFLGALFLLGVGWNFLFTGATTLAMTAYQPNERDKAQAAINFFVFGTMAFTSFGSGALVTSHGWSILNWGSLAPVVITGLALYWLAQQRKKSVTPA